MSLDRSHLEYPARTYGMDHDRYQWSMLKDRPAISWPGGAKLALWINVSLQHFPLNQSNQPFAPPGGMTMPYPDLRHYSLRDYGNRIGVFRVMSALERSHMSASFAVNAELCEKAPHLIQKLTSRGFEILGHGWNMDSLHYGGLAFEDEQTLINKSLHTLRRATGQPIRGWLSPARNESENTPDLLAESGIDYFCDWVNDDLPFPFKTRAGTLTSLPLSTELEDRFVIMNNLHSEQSWVEQVCDACNMLLDEAEQEGGRLLALSLHPWLIGQPHRIGQLERLLAYLGSRPGVWNATPASIVDHWQNQQT